MSVHARRAEVLFAQERWSEAAESLREALNERPSDPYLLYMLAICAAEQGNHEEGLKIAAESISADPDLPVGHEAMARVLLEARKYPEAEKSAAEAIRIDPEDERLFSLLAAALYEQKKWKEALEAAEEGLALDPEHSGCANLRAMALVGLGRRDEAFETVDSALRREPNNAVTHANRGWALLHAVKPDEAAAHFREALRLNPNLEWAREGMIEALKARHFIYRQLLRFFLFMSRMDSRTQWGTLIGLYILARVLGNLGRTYPSIAPITVPLTVLYLVFVFLTWTAGPLFNLLLRVHPLGRFALNDDQRMASSVVGCSLLVAIVSIAAGVLMPSIHLILFGIGSGIMIIPIAGAFAASPGGGRLLLGGYAALLGVAMTTASVSFQPGPATSETSLFRAAASAFFVGLLIFTFFANYIYTRNR